MMQGIQEAITKNLPAQTAEILKQFIEQAKQDKIELAGEIRTNLELRESNKALLQSIAKHNELGRWEQELHQKKDFLDEKERNLKMAILECKLEAEQDKAKFAQDLAMALVNNSDYKKSLLLTRTEHIPNHGSFFNLF